MTRTQDAVGARRAGGIVSPWRPGGGRSFTEGRSQRQRVSIGGALLRCFSMVGKALKSALYRLARIAGAIHTLCILGTGLDRVVRVADPARALVGRERIGLLSQPRVGNARAQAPVG